MAKVAVVTGAGTGVGRAVALGLLEKGYNVALAGRRIPELEQTASLARPGAALVVPTDCSDEQAVDALFERTVAEFGRVDLLFNNAGRGAPPVPFEDLPTDKWKEVVDVNLTAPFLCAQEAFRIMKDQTPRGGRIINNGSISAHTPRPLSVAYTSTKHAITGLTKCIALDGRVYDIAGSQIDIGNAATPMTERMVDGVLQPSGEKKPEPRMDADHVGQAVAYIAGLPLESNVLFMTVMATKMPFVGRG